MDVPVSWNGKAFARLTRSYLLVRNTGNKVLEPGDLVGEPMLRVAKTTEIVEASVKMLDDPGSEVQLLPRGEATRALHFKFLRPRDAIIIKVDHTGGTNEIFLDGRTKAGGPLKKQGSTLEILSFLGTVFGGSSLLGSVILTVALTADQASSKQIELAQAIKASFVLGMVLLAIISAAVALVLYLARLIGLRSEAKPTRKLWKSIVADRHRARA
ncbi:hypothetical protein ABIA00_006207 [Bradyrhizobium ottawaense]